MTTMNEVAEIQGKKESVQGAKGSFFWSGLQEMGTVSFPQSKGIRVLMMPFSLDEPISSLPENMDDIRLTVAQMVAMSPVKSGIAYLTIDEKFVEAGQTQRRPGLHVDGVGPDGATLAGYSPGGAGYSPSEPTPYRPRRSDAPSRRHGESAQDYERRVRQWEQNNLHEGVPSASGDLPEIGMLITSSVIGCQAWTQSFEGWPSDNGDCAHLAPQCIEDCRTVLQPGVVYALTGYTVHQSVPMEKSGIRQFIRISMPSKSVWYETNTPNPLGILPEGKIVGPRCEAFMQGRNK